MSFEIASSDRKLLWIGGGVLLLMLVASVLLAPPDEQLEAPFPSTYSAHSSGAEAAYTLLTTLHYPVRRWEESPTQLPSDPSDTLLILAEPRQPPEKTERKALASFVQQGGHVLFTGGAISLYFPEASLSSDIPDPAWQSLAPQIPGTFAQVAPHVTMQPQAYWGKLSESQLVLYGEPTTPAVVSWAYGKGHILWWAGSTPLTNAGIGRSDNLAFFLHALADSSEDNEPYNILWDEYFHGQRSSVWSYVGKTSLAWGALQLALLAVAVLLTFSRRSGPTFVPRGVSRLSPLEFVDTLGGLYQRAGAASFAVAISLLRLRSLLVRQLGLPSNTSDIELSQAAELRLGWRNSGLGELLQRSVQSARAVKLPPREALQLVRELEGHAANLRFRSHPSRENI